MGRHSKHLMIHADMVEDFLEEDDELSFEEVIEIACRVKNERHIENRYSPC